jgi:hypothetical protein
MGVGSFQITTLAPCSAIMVAVAKPNPFKPAPPVMTATLFFNSMFVSFD